MHRHLDEHPDDWGTRLVLADLLSETGDDWAEACQRWMVLHRRCPIRGPFTPWWSWDDEGNPNRDYPDLGQYLPTALHRLIVNHTTPYRQTAERQLAWALRQTGAMDEVR